MAGWVGRGDRTWAPFMAPFRLGLPCGMGGSRRRTFACMAHFLTFVLDGCDGKFGPFILWWLPSWSQVGWVGRFHGTALVLAPLVPFTFPFWAHGPGGPSRRGRARLPGCWVVWAGLPPLPISLSLMATGRGLVVHVSFSLTLGSWVGLGHGEGGWCVPAWSGGVGSAQAR